MDQPFISMIMIWAPDFAPQNWSFCAGQLIAISQNQALFSLIGTTYGGDGHTTFALPDLRGRAPTGVGHGPGLDPIQLGWHGGTNEVTLTQVNMPAHSHDAGSMSAATQAWDTPGTDHNPLPGERVGRCQARFRYHGTGCFRLRRSLRQRRRFSPAGISMARPAWPAAASPSASCSLSSA